MKNMIICRTVPRFSIQNLQFFFSNGLIIVNYCTWVRHRAHWIPLPLWLAAVRYVLLFVGLLIFCWPRRGRTYVSGGVDNRSGIENVLLDAEVVRSLKYIWAIWKNALNIFSNTCFWFRKKWYASFLICLINLVSNKVQIWRRILLVAITIGTIVWKSYGVEKVGRISYTEPLVWNQVSWKVDAVLFLLL